jgi:hypothetical protein
MDTKHSHPKPRGEKARPLEPGHSASDREPELRSNEERSPRLDPGIPLGREPQARYREELVLGGSGGGLGRRDVGVEPPDAPIRSLATVRLQTWLQVVRRLPTVDWGPLLNRLWEASIRKERLSLRVTDQTAPVSPRGPLLEGQLGPGRGVRTARGGGSARSEGFRESRAGRGAARSPRTGEAPCSGAGSRTRRTHPSPRRRSARGKGASGRRPAGPGGGTRPAAQTPDGLPEEDKDPGLVGRRHAPRPQRGPGAPPQGRSPEQCSPWPGRSPPAIRHVRLSGTALEACAELELRRLRSVDHRLQGCVLLGGLSGGGVSSSNWKRIRARWGVSRTTKIRSREAYWVKPPAAARAWRTPAPTGTA